MKINQIIKLNEEDPMGVGNDWVGSDGIVNDLETNNRIVKITGEIAGAPGATAEEIIDTPWYKRWYKNMGYGITKLGRGAKWTLKWVAVPVIALYDCYNAYQEIAAIPKDDPDRLEKGTAIISKLVASYGLPVVGGYIGALIGAGVGVWAGGIGALPASTIGALIGTASAITAQVVYGDDIDAEIEKLVSAIFDVIDSEDSETTTTPQDTESNTSPVPAGQPNFDNLSYEDAWKAARKLATELDPDEPGSYSFVWQGKTYPTSSKDEPLIPAERRRNLITLNQLNEGIGSDIGAVIKDLFKGAKTLEPEIKQGADAAADAARAAEDAAAALKAGQSAEDAANVAKELNIAIRENNKFLAGLLNDASHVVELNGKKYARYYSPAKDKWIWTDIQAAEAGGKRSSGFVADATAKELDDLIKSGTDTATDAAKVADDAAKAADDATTTPPAAADDAATSTTPKPAEPTTPKAPEPATPAAPSRLTPEYIAKMKAKPVSKWTDKELAEWGYPPELRNAVSFIQKTDIDMLIPLAQAYKVPMLKSIAQLAMKTPGALFRAVKLPVTNPIAILFITAPAALTFFKGVLELDPSDPQYKEKLTKLVVEFVETVGIGVAAWYISGFAGKKLAGLLGLSEAGAFAWLLKWVARGGTIWAVNENATIQSLIQDLIGKGADAIVGPTTNNNATIKTNPLYKQGFDWAKARGYSDHDSDAFARHIVQQGGFRNEYKFNEHATNTFALAWLYKQLNESNSPVRIVKINKHIKNLLEYFDNSNAVHKFAISLSESISFNEEQTNNFMTNITAAIAANTKGDKMGAQKALDAAKQSQPATAQDQINQKKVLDQMARTNPGLNIPNTNQNVTEDDPMGAGNDWATTANANDPTAKGTDLLAAYNEFAAKYPAAKFLLDIVPVTGTATSVIDASQDLYNGKYGKAALDILGAIPGFKIGKYISQGLAKAIKAANVTTKTANYANATAGLVGNEINESPKVGDHMMLELADGRVVVAPIAELRGNGIVVELDETGNQWLEESPEHHALKIGQGDGHPLSTTAEIWNAMIDQLPSDTPDGWAEVFISMQNQTGQPARIMPRLWSQIWRQQHNALGDSLTRVDMTNWAEEVGKALDRSGLVESSIEPSNSNKLKKHLDPKDPAMLAVWMASRAGIKGVPVDKFAKAKAVQSGLPADHWWKKIKKLVQEGAVPTVPRLLAARDIEPLVHFEGDYYIVSHNDGKHLKYDLVKKVVATTDRNTPAYQHVDHLDTGLHRITKEQLRRLANVAMEADKLADGEDDTPDLPDLLGVIAQVMGRKVRKHPDALSTTVKKSDMGYVVSNLLVRHLDGTEAQDLKNALHRAGYNVSKVIINPTTILVILKTTKTTPNTTAIITATPQPDVVGGLAESAYAMEKRYYIVRKDVPTAPVPGMSGYHQKSEADKKLASMKNSDQYMVRAIDSKRLPKDEIAEARRDFNFDENDIARIAAMDDLDAAKRYAIKLITAKTRRPMTKDKIMWFTNSINDTKTMNRLVKMLYDMMLSGEGHGVIGDRYSTGKSSYRRQFDEESQRLDPKCWKGYRKQGTKVKDGVRVNNCVKVNEEINEAEYQGKSVPLNKPIRTSPSEGGKFKVYVKDPKTGNIKMVRFGDTTGLTIKRDDPERRKNFRARHHCDNPGPKTKARYWSCKMWTRKPVGQVLKGK